MQVPYFCVTLSSLISLTTPIVGDNQYLSHSEKTSTSQGEPNFVDGSGPIFSMYLERAKEKDETIAESWQADANGILVFVRLSYPVLHTDSSIVDWFILHCRRFFKSRCRFRTLSRPPRHLQLLPREYMLPVYW